MFDVGGGEFIFILIAVLILFGPKKIPEVTKTVSKGLRQIRKAQAQFQNQIRDLEREVEHSTKDVRDTAQEVSRVANDIKPDLSDIKGAPKPKPSPKPKQNFQVRVPEEFRNDDGAESQKTPENVANPDKPKNDKKDEARK